MTDYYFDYVPRHAAPEPVHLAGVYTPAMTIMSLVTDGCGRISLLGFDDLVYWTSEVYPDGEGWGPAQAEWEEALLEQLKTWAVSQEWTA